MKKKRNKIKENAVTGDKPVAALKVSNACEENKESFAHFPSTTKKNREFHGWGLPSVKDAVEKYNGTLKCINEEKQFIVKIMLFFEKNTN